MLAERRTLTDAHFSSITKEKRAMQLAELLADVLEKEWQQAFLHTRTKLPDVPNENVIIELREALKVYEDGNRFAHLVISCLSRVQFSTCICCNTCKQALNGM